MRLHSLEVEGFGPFRERQVVDFDGFADDGVFLIAGRTGAGKSSILDAVCFGLYGGVPRYEGGEKRLRSDHSEPDDPSEVVVEFSTPAGRFKVTRSPEYERPKKRGGGMTTQVASVSLEEWTDAGWVGRAARAVDVAGELDEILQLSREQFLQVILLAQNRFSEFLLANSKERQALLRRLFGTERFEAVQSRFEERRRAAENDLGVRLATVTARVEEGERLVTAAGLWGEKGAAGPVETSNEAEPLAPRTSGTTDERLDDLSRARARADYRAERRAAERKDAEELSVAVDDALAKVREQRRDQKERDRARAAMTQLDVEEPQITAARAELERARAAETLRAVLAAANRAKVALLSAQTAEQEADAVWRERGVDAGAEASEKWLREWATERARERGAWELALALEKQTPQLDAELRVADERIQTASARIEASATERAELSRQITALTAERDLARRSGDRAADLLIARNAAEVRLEGARDVVRLVEERTRAERALSDATDVHAAALSALAQLRRRRSDGIAGELASTLLPGDACPVCGAHEHPVLAVHSDPVSAGDVEAAEGARDKAAQGERAATEQVATLKAALAVAETRADHRSVEHAERELVDATEEHARSVADAETMRAREERLEELAARTVHLEHARATDDSALATAREQCALLTQRQTESAQQITAARGTFDTVAERIDESTAQSTAALRLADARAEVERRAATEAEAADEQAIALTASAFDSVAAVEAALRSSPQQQELDARITAHAVQREKEREILFDLELRTLPEEPIDVAPSERASAEARTAWTAAVDEAGRAEGTAGRLAALLDSAASEHARTAAQAADFEVLRDLADTIAGRGANIRKMTLETFVLAAELEEIVTAANRRLNDMSTGRYQLRHSDALAARGAASGLGIVVFDAFTGQTRPAQSLSGGETFLSSLSLALGLAEVVTARAGGIRLDTLFIDEGFGSLDGDTLDIAMRTLDELRQGGRTVGVISHVEAMQEQIPAQLRVRATAAGPSVIEAR